jgi:hypothetical protein
MKRVAIVQSNYIPWKGYFDLIAHVNEFILYDDVQFTKSDWRNRNLIKTPSGVQWLTIPVGQATHRRIRDVRLPEGRWREWHWKAIEMSYRRAPWFSDVAPLIRGAYQEPLPATLSEFNRRLIEFVCRYLGISTRISNSWDYRLVDGKTERLVDICRQAGADEYVSGPAARDYIREQLFEDAKIKLTWFDYKGYPEYSQLWGAFVHEVTVLDLLFNCGPDSSRYMRYVPTAGRP